MAEHRVGTIQVHHVWLSMYLARLLPAPACHTQRGVAACRPMRPARVAVLLLRPARRAAPLLPRPHPREQLLTWCTYAPLPTPFARASLPPLHVDSRRPHALN